MQLQPKKLGIKGSNICMHVYIYRCILYIRYIYIYSTECNHALRHMYIHHIAAPPAPFYSAAAQNSLPRNQCMLASCSVPSPSTTLSLL